MPTKTRDNTIVWFEIPVRNFDRALGFYETVLCTRLLRENSGPYQIGIFPAKNKTKGCIIGGEGYRASHESTMVYVNADGQLPQALRRVREAGGEIVQDTTPLPDNMGMYAIIRDTEGNRVGLHAA